MRLKPDRTTVLSRVEPFLRANFSVGMPHFLVESNGASMMNGPRWPNIRPMPMTLKQSLSGLTANHRLILV
jgi:hypothetical protein